MSKWQDKSDFEINKAVAISLDKDGSIESVTQNKSKLKCLNSIALIKFKDWDSLEKFDPCNNPSEAWGIIIENKISLIKFDDYDDWIACEQIEDSSHHELGGCTINGESYSDKDNPLRAAMIVYLEMNGVKP